MYTTDYIGRDIGIVGFVLRDDYIEVRLGPTLQEAAGLARPVLDKSLTCLLGLDDFRYRLWEFSRRFLEEPFFSPTNQ